MKSLDAENSVAVDCLSVADLRRKFAEIDARVSADTNVDRNKVRLALVGLNQTRARILMISDPELLAKNEMELMAKGANGWSERIVCVVLAVVFARLLPVDKLPRSSLDMLRADDSRWSNMAPGVRSDALYLRETMSTDILLDTRWPLELKKGLLQTIYSLAERLSPAPSGPIGTACCLDHSYSEFSILAMWHIRYSGYLELAAYPGRRKEPLLNEEIIARAGADVNALSAAMMIDWKAQVKASKNYSPSIPGLGTFSEIRDLIVGHWDAEPVLYFRIGLAIAVFLASVTLWYQHFV